MTSLRGIILLLAGLPTAGMAGNCTLADLAWLAGHWRSDQVGVIAEEVWLQPRGGMMLAVGRTVHNPGGQKSDSRGRATAFFEYLRIESRDNGPVLIASPLGKTGTEFPLTECGPGHASFTNPDHDFPQTLQYQRENNQLKAIATGEGRPEQTFNWSLVEN